MLCFLKILNNLPPKFVASHQMYMLDKFAIFKNIMFSIFFVTTVLKRHKHSNVIIQRIKNFKKQDLPMKNKYFYAKKDRNQKAA